jgi:glycosyltransferase involved in cell wall biosynthesis
VRRQAPSDVVVLLRGMNWRLILACRLLGVRVIATEHTNHLAERGIFSWIERHLIYKMANDLVVLTEFDGAHYRKFLPNVHVIPNPLSFTPGTGQLTQTQRILAVGDLNRWYIKGFDNLIKIFASIHHDFPDWRLAIAGDGAAGLQYLERLAEKYEVRDYVDFLGFCDNIDRQMQNSELFVLSSRYEGFSMVLLEAMSQGCACISFDCHAGPRDLLKNGVSGMLVPDQDCAAMEQVIRVLIESENVRHELSTNSIRASHAYVVGEVAKTWMKLLNI